MLDKLLKHKTALAFVGGVATGLIAIAVVESDVVRDASSKVLSELDSFKSEIEDIYFDIDNDVEEVRYVEKE